MAKSPERPDLQFYQQKKGGVHGHYSSQEYIVQDGDHLMGEHQRRKTGPHASHPSNQIELWVKHESSEADHDDSESTQPLTPQKK